MSQVGLRWSSLLLLMLLPLGACHDGPTDPDETDASLTISLNTSGTSIASIVVTVSAADIPTDLVFNFTVQNETVVGTITIPAGSDRLVEVSAYDAAGVETHRGSAMVTVDAGDVAPISLILAALTADVPVTVAFGALSIDVGPEVDTLFAGDTLRLSAVVTNHLGDTIAATVLWAVSQPRVAVIDQSGLLSTSDSGNVRAIATVGGAAGIADVRVRAAGYALRFDGAQIVSVPDAAALSPSSEMTLEFWVRFDSIARGQWAVLKDNGTVRQYAIGLNGEGSPGPARRMRAHIRTTSGYSTVDGATIIPFGTWVHVAQTYDGTDLRLYVNGELDGSATVSEAMVAEAIDFTMGNNPEEFPLHGALDEVRLWSVARSAPEIAGTLATALTGSESGLVAYWSLDDGAGQTAADAVGTSNGVLGLAAGPDAGDPRWVVQTSPVR